ncbi:hypothetical protein AAC387_Pa07g3065 [Persea americana]
MPRKGIYLPFCNFPHLHLLPLHHHSSPRLSLHYQPISSRPHRIARPHLRSPSTFHHPSSRRRTSQAKNQPPTSPCKSSSPTSIPAQEAPGSQPITSPSSPLSLSVDRLLHRHSQRVQLIPLVSGLDSTPGQHSFAAILSPFRCRTRLKLEKFLISPSLTRND